MAHLERSAEDMRRFLYPVFLMSLISGCVIAPLPLIEASRRSMWDGTDNSSSRVSIVEEQRTWYLPIVASPEGPAKKRSQKSECRYFFGIERLTEEKRDWQKIADIPWLTIEEDPEFYTWHKITRLTGTDSWVAFRRVSSDRTGMRGGTFEVAVFDRRSLLTRHIVASESWAAVQTTDQEYLADVGYEPKTQSIVLQSSNGLRRYFLMTGTEKEEPNQSLQPTRSARG